MYVFGVQSNEIHPNGNANESNAKVTQKVKGTHWNVGLNDVECRMCTVHEQLKCTLNQHIRVYLLPFIKQQKGVHIFSQIRIALMP